MAAATTIEEPDGDVRRPALFILGNFERY